MSRSLYLLLLLAGFFCISQAAFAQDWQLAVPTQEAASPYNLYYYKLIQINQATARYASIIDVSVQGDANYYYMQGTYRIRVDKFESSTRFDGLEIQCTSGNPLAAVFYIFNDALWVRSNYKWGGIYYRTEANFVGTSPLNTTPFGQALTAPTGYLSLVTNGAVKCDFDNAKYTLLPISDVNGVQTFYSNVSLTQQGKIGIGLADQFVYDGKNQPHYGFQWTPDTWSMAGPSYWLSSYGGIKIFTQAALRMVVTDNGNVGIGTDKPQAKLAVNGDIFSKRVKVTLASIDWPDYVFRKDYKLPSLQSVDTYIQEHQHLPGIPDAAAIEKDGLDVGEMNRKLLEKIEETTLYLIELNKKVDRLEKENAVLRKKLQFK